MSNGHRSKSVDISPELERTSPRALQHVAKFGYILQSAARNFRVPTSIRGHSSSSKEHTFQRRHARRRAAAQDTPIRKHRSSFHGHANTPEYNLRTRRRSSRQEYQGSSITSTEPYANQGDERFNHA